MKKVFVLTICAAGMMACNQGEVDPVAVEEEVDSVATEMFDDLNAGFDEEETADEAGEVSAADSMADAAMDEVLNE